MGFNLPVTGLTNPGGFNTNGSNTLSTQGQSSPPGLPASTPAPITPGNNGSPDVLSQLHQLTYNGIPFPCLYFSEAGSQDISIHKYPDKDGADVENLGRNPLMLKVRAVLTNSISPGPTETWVQGTLYPTTFQSLMTQLYQSGNSNGDLVHPSLGNLNVMVHTWNYEYIGTGPRDGVYLDIEWVETFETQSLVATISAPSSVSSLINAGSQVDTQLADPIIQGLTPVGINLVGSAGFPVLSFSSLNATGSFSGFFSTLSNSIANFISFPQRVVGAINASVFSTVGDISTLAKSFTQTSNVSQQAVNVNKGLVAGSTVNTGLSYSSQYTTDMISTLVNVNNSANNNPTQMINSAIAFTVASINYYQSLNRVETAAMVQSMYLYLQSLQTILANQAVSQPYPVQQYLVKVPTSLLQLSLILNNTVDQLLSLNAQALGGSYLVSQNTSVNYFQGS